MSYVLEDQNEFTRLENQSKNELYDFKKDLKDFVLERPIKILDAGCGSGIVSRHLAETYSESRVIGCDFSKSRVKLASEAGKAFKNLEFRKEDLTALKFDTGTFDAVFCRYVLEHLSNEQRTQAAGEMLRCLRPGAQIRVVDIDGCYFNLFPQSQLVREFVEILAKKQPIDMQIGRKLPKLIVDAGFVNVSWKIEVMEMHGRNLDLEYQLMEERFQHAKAMFVDLLGSESKATAFQAEFLASLRRAGTTLFYNKFIVTANKPNLTLVDGDRS